MKKPPNQTAEPKTMLGMAPFKPAPFTPPAAPPARNDEPKTTINTSPSLQIAMRMRARAVEAREPRASRPASPPTVLVPPGFVQRQAQAQTELASPPTPTPLSRTRTSFVRRSRSLLTGSAGVVLIVLLVLRPDLDPTGVATILHDAAFGRSTPPAPLRSATPSARPAPRPDAPRDPQANPAPQPHPDDARAGKSAPVAPPRDENTARRLKDAPPLPSSSKPGAGAAPPKLAALEKQAVEMLIANQFEAAHATYAKLLAADPSHREYAVMLKLLASKLRTE